MPERPLTIATYAVSASVAALVVGYIFGPTIFPDDGGYSGNRRKNAVGLSNSANDCFINSILQAFAGLRSFRDYLDAECRLHVEAREPTINEDDLLHKQHEVLAHQKPLSRALRDAIVTHALKAKLDELSETSAFKKTISAGDFVRTLEFAFGTHISRQQQDAQEFLHVVAERLCDEFHACRKASNSEKENSGKLNISSQDEEEQPLDSALENLSIENIGSEAENNEDPSEKTAEVKETNDLSDVFPLEGVMESHVECQTCQFKPKPSSTSFVTLTLNVPQKNATTLDECLDGLLKAEFIDGYKCDRCRIEHALQVKRRQLAQASSSSPAQVKLLEHQKHQLQQALEDPENPPADIELPDRRMAPQRRISKHIRISTYPKILALHLSRSIFSTSSLSVKNKATVEFPEILTLGVLRRRTYKLSCLVTHRGGHNSGHYETCRRQSATVHSLPIIQDSGVQSGQEDSTPPSALLLEVQNGEKQSLKDERDAPEEKTSRRKQKHKEKGAIDNKWWCISDAKIRACNTEDVLGMRKEAYLLYYELKPGCE